MGSFYLLGVMQGAVDPTKLVAFKSYASWWQVWILPPFLYLAWIVVQLMRRKNAKPLKTVVRLIRYKREWVARVFVLLLLIPAFMGTFSGLKSNIPSVVPFYADPYAADLEAALFGSDAWRLTHTIIGPFGSAVLDRLYLLWFLPMAGIQAWLHFAGDRDFQIRGLLTFYGAWFLLGITAATALSSVGPVFYDVEYGGDRFAPMLAALRDLDGQVGIKAIGIADWLIEKRATGEFGTGISALPSMHVAIAYMLPLFLRDRFGKTWAYRAGIVWTALIWIASVHLGWHYAIDGLISIVGVKALWHLFGYANSTQNHVSASVPRVRPKLA